MPKTIAFCSDGTWNSPGNDQDKDDLPDPTNVYKLFTMLDGVPTDDTMREANEQEKLLGSPAAPVQVAKYIHGVGDSRHPIVKLMGGTFGAGVLSRVVRGYTFISRNYEPGDDIVIVGFSRGAYTARALGGLIASQGLLDPALTQDKELAYRRGGEAWARYRRAGLKSKRNALAALAEILADLPGFVSQKNLRDEDLRPLDRIAAVAVWDTVGAMGLPAYAGGSERVDAFQFADLALSAKVGKGLHAVALDEQRADFTPTLWEAAPNVTQVLFPGAHCDVGGGYPKRDRQSGLSDGALKWMTEQLAGIGVRFDAAKLASIQPDAGGVAHQPWVHAPWPLFRTVPRRFGDVPLVQHESVGQRRAAGPVVAEPGLPPAPYAPPNL